MALKPLVVRASFVPAVVDFGAPVDARVVVLVDPARIRPSSVRISGGVAPLGVTSSSRTAHGAVVAVDREAACLVSACLAPDVRLPPATVTAVTVAGRTVHAVAPWPRLVVHGRLSAPELAHARPSFAGDTTPPPSSYAVAPAALAWALDGAGALLALAAALLLALQLRAHRRRRRVPDDTFQRALRLARAAAGRSPGDRRRALELLARVLARRDGRLASVAERLAWSEAAPDAAAVSALVDEASP